MNARELVAALRGDWHGTYGNVPAPGHSLRDRSVKVWDVASGDLRLHSFAGEDWREIKDAWRRSGLLPSGPTTAHDVVVRSNGPPVASNAHGSVGNVGRRTSLALKIWRESRSIADTCVARYFASRAIRIPTTPTIRFHPGLRYPFGRVTLPAAVFAVQDAERRLLGIQRLFLTQQGEKVGGGASRLALGQIRGGAVRLAPTTDTVVLVEGVEDGLAVQQMTNAPCWAVLGTSGFLNVELPPRITCVVLAPDGDEAGRSIVERAGERLIDKGLQVDIARPTFGSDWADLLFEFEECAAIAEFDDQLPREDADELARQQTLGDGD